MKPFRKSNRSRRMLRWFRNGSIIGFVLAFMRLLIPNGDAADQGVNGDVLVLNAISFASIILLAGVAGGLMAVIANWIKR